MTFNTNFENIVFELILLDDLEKFVTGSSQTTISTLMKELRRMKICRDHILEDGLISVTDKSRYEKTEILKIPHLETSITVKMAPVGDLAWIEALLEAYSRSVKRYLVYKLD